MDSINLPGAGRTTTRLGFGCAYLLPETAHLLEVAYDAGIRHFDVARAYGRGLTEGLIGRFLARRQDVTLTTKYGILPPASTRLYGAARKLLKPMVKRLRRAPAMDAKITQSIAAMQRKAVFSAEEAAASLATSLRQLKRDRVDVFLMHEASLEDLADDRLLRFLEDRKAAGVIGAFGVGGHSERVDALFAQRRPFCGVLQHDWTPTERVIDRPGSFSIMYRVFGDGVRHHRSRLSEDAPLRERWSREIGFDLGEPGAFERLMLKAALLKRPGSLVLFSSNRPDNIRRNVETAENGALDAPALRLVRLLEGPDALAAAG